MAKYATVDEILDWLKRGRRLKDLTGKNPRIVKIGK